MNNFSRCLHFVQRNITHRHYQEIHVETIIQDRVFKLLTSYAQKNPQTMFMLTGWNEPWIKGRIQAEFIGDKEYADRLATRYILLGKTTGNIGLHVHLFHPRTMKTPSYEWQHAKIKESKSWLESFGFILKDFAPGWWGYNLDTVRACHILGIKRFHHDIARKPPKFDNIEYVKVWRVCDDFQLRSYKEG